MQYTPQQVEGFRAEFRRRRRNQILIYLPMIAGAIVVRFGGPWSAQDSERIWAVAVIASIVLTIRNWRCPACERYLGRRFSLEFCPRCGAPLR